MKLIPPPGERALPLVAGVLLALAYPPLALLLPAFVGLVPLLVFIAEQPPGPVARWRATRAGLTTGFVYFGLQLYWLVVALIRYSPLAIPAYLGTVVVLTGFAGLFAWAVHYSRERLALPLTVAAALFWPTLEWLQGHLGDLSFPWLGLGAALAPFPRLAGAADLVGSRGLTVWIAATNGLVATAVLRYRHGRPARAALAGLALMVTAPAAYGLVRARTLELRTAATVAVVQPNIPEDLKLDRRTALDTSLAALTRLTSSLEGRGVDLVAWPEVALPADFAGNPRLRDVVHRLSRQVDAPILVGAYGLDDDGTAYNSAFLVDASEVHPDRYDKRRLVPFVERVPFIDPALLEGLFGDVRYFGGLGRGRAAPVLPAGPERGFGTLICYESIFAGLARGYRRAGADFLVNMTNDGWYGRDQWYARTTALWQHPAHMTLRAIENRIGVARAANTGISMFIDPVGRSYGRTRLFEPAVRVETVYTTDGLTLFARWGDWLGTLVVIAAAVVLGVSRIEDRGSGIGDRGSGESRGGGS